MSYQAEVSKRFIKAMRFIIANEMADNVSDFAEQIGAYQSAISFIKKGERYATLDMVCTMCEKFNVNPSWILLNKGEMFNKSKVSN